MEMVRGGLLNSETDLAPLTSVVIFTLTNRKALPRFSPLQCSMPQKGIRKLL